MSSNQNTRDKIIQAALAVIGERGTNGVTSRIIAGKAKVNHAAINYYFNSKEDLIEKALEHYYEGLEDVFLILKDQKISAKERLIKFAEDYIRYDNRFPGVKHHIMSRLMVENITDSKVSGLMPGNLQAIKLVFKEILEGKDEKTISFKAIAFISGLVYPLLLMRYGDIVMSSDYGDNALTREYIEELINGLTKK
ncbi:MAG: TetR family transcriptional regulator [Syntrophomonadaceae bacterium]